MGSCRWFFNQVAGNRLKTHASTRTVRSGGVGATTLHWRRAGPLAWASGKLVSLALMAVQENPSSAQVIRGSIRRMGRHLDVG